jgi:capsid protein
MPFSLVTVCDTLDPVPAWPVCSPRGCRQPVNSAAGGYDCTRNTGQRKPPTALLRSEDDELLPTPRGQVITLGRDVRRNFAIAAWAIRKHIDYVATFHYHCQTGDETLDGRVEELVEWWAKPRNFDAAGRHGRRRMLRLLEGARTTDGDVGLLKLASGKVQAVEGDRVRTPMAWPEGQQGAPDWLPKMKHGVVCGEANQALAYAINKRGLGFQYGPDWFFAANSFIFERLVPARDMILHGYFDRIDQIRGISPIAAALNSFRDVYEGFNYALAQAKVAQLFALAIKRNSTKALEEFDSAEGPSADYRKQIDFNRGAALLDLDPGDEADFLESNNPSANWQAFMNLVIAASLVALDIPLIFFDCTKGNYAQTRGSWILYDHSATAKRADNRELLDDLTAWRMAMFLYYGTLQVPDGFPLQKLLGEWISDGVPWIDPLKDIQADGQAVDRGFASTPGICKQNGKNAYRIVDEQASYLAYRVSRGLAPPYPVAPMKIPGEAIQTDDETAATPEEEGATA